MTVVRAATMAIRLPRWRARPMAMADLDEVGRIEVAVHPFPWTRGNFADSLAAGYEAWCMEVDETMVGYAVSMGLPDEVHLLNLSVDTPMQCRGLGWAMLAWLLADSARRGANSMLLEVRPSNHRARALYTSMGFQQIGVRRRYYPSWDGAREDALVLQRPCADE
jgi:ribosomal-protein-alanine N-acetyltransferase